MSPVRLGVQATALAMTLLPAAAIGETLTMHRLSAERDSLQNRSVEVNLRIDRRPLPQPSPAPVLPVPQTKPADKVHRILRKAISTEPSSRRDTVLVTFMDPVLVNRDSVLN